MLECCFSRTTDQQIRGNMRNTWFQSLSAESGRWTVGSYATSSSIVRLALTGSAAEAFGFFDSETAVAG